MDTNTNSTLPSSLSIDNSIKKLFTNIDGFLYDDVKSLITSNESFGNNILSNSSESFNISSYLTFQLLSENLINIGSDFSFDNLNEILKINHPNNLLVLKKVIRSENFGRIIRFIKIIYEKN